MDYMTWTCDTLATFIADPNTDPIERAAAQSAYDSKNCSGTGGTGTGGQSGGGGGHGLPHGG